MMQPLLRFTLDLFAPAAPVRVPLPAQPPGPYVAGVALPQAIAPAQFSHPRANRSTRIADAVVAYAFTRAKRRSIGFVVGPDGLSVRAPRWTPLHEVETALQEKGAWILRKLQESHERQTRVASESMLWRDGVELPFLGQPLRVQLDPAHSFGGKGAQLEAATAHSAATLRVGLPHSAQPEQIRDAVLAWLMQQALVYFRTRMEHFAPQLQVRWSKLRLSNANTRWGSASSDGSIRLNWRLMHFRAPIIDYVIAHELSHLRVMNHSPRFWDTVASVVPNYADLRSQLKDSPVPRW